MAWVPLHLSGRTYQFTSSSETPAVLADSVVYPNGSSARFAPWDLFVDGPPTKLGITAFLIEPQSITTDDGFIEGGWYAYQTNILGYRVESGGEGLVSIADTQPNEPEFVITDDSAFWTEPMYLQYVAPRSNLDNSFQGNNYNVTVWVWQDEAPPDVGYNCECDDDYPRTTLAEMRKRLLRRLGFSAQANNPPPGMAEMLDDFIRNAQEMLFRRYSVFQRERFYTWDLIAGTRFYDLDANADVCTKRLDPRMVSWVGISQGAGTIPPPPEPLPTLSLARASAFEISNGERYDTSWRPLVCGIHPTRYSSLSGGIPSHYEIRQCIEVWPPPSDNTWKLRIKGQFGLMPLEQPTDTTTVEPEAIFLLALANAKAHYGQPDAGNYATQLQSYIKDLIRGSHHTRRYLPGSADARNAVRPIPVGGWPEDAA